MSEERLTEKTEPARREKIRVRVTRLRQSRQGSALGVPELVGLAGSAVMLFAVVFTYLYFYSPAQSRLTTAQQERARLQQKLSEMQRDLEVKGTTQDSVARIGESLNAFENERLTTREQGRITLYNVLIQLIRSNNLRNTSGPAYAPLEAKAADTTQSARAGNRRWQSLYPGINVTVTVEGQYANLRRFVRDIESSSQFIIINAIELERAADSDNAPAVAAAPDAPAAAAAAPRSTLVSLKVDMVAYFRREGAAAPAEGDAPQPAGETR